MNMGATMQVISTSVLTKVNSAGPHCGPNHAEDIPDRVWTISLTLSPR